MIQGVTENSGYGPFGGISSRPLLTSYDTSGKYLSLRATLSGAVEIILWDMHSLRS